MRLRVARPAVQSAGELTSEAARPWAARQLVEFLALDSLEERRTPQQPLAAFPAIRPLLVGSRAQMPVACLQLLELVAQYRAVRQQGALRVEFLALAVLVEPRR